MSVTKRKLKSAAELQAWLTDRARDFPREWAEAGELVIVQRSPRTGAANWTAVEREGTKSGRRQSGVVRSLIGSAQMQFDLL